MKKTVVILMAAMLLTTLFTGCSMLGNKEDAAVQPNAVVTPTPAPLPTVEATANTAVTAAPTTDTMPEAGDTSAF